MINKLVFLCTLWGAFLAPVFGQGVRYDSRVLTVAGNMPPFANAPVLAIPKAKVTICTDGNCLNAPAAIYSNQALTVQTGNPLTTDGQGRFGFWASAGTYFYKVVLPSGSVQGIYPITLGGSGGGGGGITQLTGDGTAAGSGSVPFTLATVNSSPGTCGDATHVCQIVDNGKGLVTSQTPVAITGGGGSVGTTGQIQKVGATAGSFAASAVTDNGTKVLSSEPVQAFSGSNFANINATATNSEVNLSTSSSSSVDVVSYANASLTTFGLDYFGTGNTLGLAGALGLFDNANNIFVWNTNQTDDLFFGTPLAGGNVVAGAGAVAKLDHLGNLTVNSCTGCGGGGAVSSVFGRTGAVVAATNDYSFSQISGSLGTTQGPALTGLLKDAAGTLSAATAGTDYLTPSGSSAGLSQATTGAFGVVKPDGTTVTISAGVISATGSGLADCTDTSTVSFICTVPISAPSFIATGTTPGAFKLTAGTGSIPALPANSGGFAAPVTGGTAYLFKLPATIAAGILHAAAPGTVDGVNESALTSSAVSLSADVTGQLPIANVGSAGLSGTSPVTIASTGVIACATCVTSVTGTAPIASSGGTTPAISITANGVTATQLAAQYSKGSCTEVWGGSGTSFALTSGDDAISNMSCINDSGVTRTITAVKCASDNASNTTTVNPTFGASGTGTTILSGAKTCGNSNALSTTGTVSNASWTTGTGINPAMSGTLTGTHIVMIVEYTF